MRILICGSRSWHDRQPIEDLLVERQAEAAARSIYAPVEFMVIHGACPDGADWLADKIALDLGLTPGVDLIREPAQWKRYGRSAGPRRNQKMLDAYQPSEVHAFRSSGKSSGTDDMVARARKAGVPTYVHVVRVTHNA